MSLVSILNRSVVILSLTQRGFFILFLCLYQRFLVDLN